MVAVGQRPQTLEEHHGEPHGGLAGTQRQRRGGHRHRVSEHRVGGGNVLGAAHDQAVGLGVDQDEVVVGRVQCGQGGGQAVKGGGGDDVDGAHPPSLAQPVAGQLSAGRCQIPWARAGKKDSTRSSIRVKPRRRATAWERWLVGRMTLNTSGRRRVEKA